MKMPVQERWLMIGWLAGWLQKESGGLAKAPWDILLPRPSFILYQSMFIGEQSPFFVWPVHSRSALEGQPWNLAAKTSPPPKYKRYGLRLVERRQCPVEGLRTQWVGGGGLQWPGSPGRALGSIGYSGVGVVGKVGYLVDPVSSGSTSLTLKLCQWSRLRQGSGPPTVSRRSTCVQLEFSFPSSWFLPWRVAPSR